MTFIVLSFILMGTYSCKEKKESTESTKEQTTEMELTYIEQLG